MSKRRKKAGLPPGSVIFTGNRKVDKVFTHYLQYNQSVLKSEIYDNQKEIVFHQSDDNIIDWYDIRGIHDTELLEKIGLCFQIHNLILEDIASTHQRPKFEEYENGVFIVLRALSFDTAELKVSTEQVAMYFKKGLMVTFQERETDLFKSVRERLDSGKGRIRKKGVDYLAYALIDEVVDNYFVVLDDIEDVIELLEDNLLSSQDESHKSKIHNLKKEMLVMRKSVSPLREAISRFSKSESPVIEEANTIFIRDLYDHTIQIMDMVESYRDMLNSLQDLFITEVSFKMNKVMQLLTLIATIFIPLTFLAGIYGMNFDNMPELHWEYGYQTLLAIMVVIFFVLLYYFKKNKWI